MIIPDANLLIYAHDEKSHYHPKAKRWWERSLSGPEAIGLPWVVFFFDRFSGIRWVNPLA